MQINILRDSTDRVAGVNLNATQLDEIIAGLARIRSEMTPAVPDRFPAGSPTHRQMNPHYFVAFEPMEGMASLSFRNAGLGWLTYVIPATEAERIRTALGQAQAHAAKPGSDKAH